MSGKVLTADFRSVTGRSEYLLRNHNLSSLATVAKLARS